MPEVLEPATPVHSAPSSEGPVYREAPFWIAAAVYVVSTFLIFGFAWHLCGGHFVYALDDVYINMAVAKNFATHGVWGVSPFEFNSTTSSPLYVLLLSGVYKLFGVNRYAPAVLSWILGLASLYVAAILLRQFLRPAWQTMILVAVILLTPMYLLGTLGMEHAMHVFAVLLFLLLFQSERRPHWQIGAATVLMCAARYEGLLMAAVAVAVLLARRRWMRAAVIGVTAWIPVACYAWFSLSHGGSWLPNSVLLKGVDMEGSSYPGKVLLLWQTTEANMEKAPHTALMSIALVILAVTLWRKRPRLAELLIVTGVAGVLHLMVAAVGWAFRYEAYLVAAGLIAVACTWPEIRRSKSLPAILAQGLLFLALGVLLMRTYLCGSDLPRYSRAIYEQQGQMARFLKTYYSGGSVAANDIGYINYETDLHCLDLAGLASTEVFHAKRTGQDTTDFLEQTAREHGVQVIILYEGWFSERSAIKFGGPELPESWDRVGQWTLPERLQLGDKTVSFFGTDSASDDLLRRRLTEFEPSLPKDVKASR